MLFGDPLPVASEVFHAVWTLHTVAVVAVACQRWLQVVERWAFFVIVLLGSRCFKLLSFDLDIVPLMCCGLEVPFLPLVLDVRILLLLIEMLFESKRPNRSVIIFCFRCFYVKLIKAM